jgi:hypothetical protein
VELFAGDVCVSKELSGTDKTSDMRTRLDRALVIDVLTAAVVKKKDQQILKINKFK